jgi:hypothetical protein
MFVQASLQVRSAGEEIGEEHNSGRRLLWYERSGRRANLHGGNRIATSAALTGAKNLHLRFRSPRIAAEEELAAGN